MSLSEFVYAIGIAVMAWTFGAQYGCPRCRARERAAADQVYAQIAADKAAQARALAEKP